MKRIRLYLASILAAPYMQNENYLDGKVARYSLVSSLEYGCAVRQNSVTWQKFPELFNRLKRYDSDLDTAVNDLQMVMEWLREEKMYAQSDRIRTITGRLARARRSYWFEKPEWPAAIARKYR